MAADEDPLAAARAALAEGNPDDALRKAFKATKSAVRQQDDDLLLRASEFAAEVAEASTGRLAKEASQYSVYWRACIDEPRDQQPNAWSFLSWFKRGPAQERTPCPECAELIVVGAKTCRFCGYRLDAPS